MKKMNQENLQLLKEKMIELHESLALWDSGIQMEKKVSDIVNSFDRYMESRRAEIELEIVTLEKMATDEVTRL